MLDSRCEVSQSFIYPLVPAPPKHSTKSQRDGSVKPKAAAKSAAKSSRAPPKAAARANDAKKQELAALMAEDERRTAKRKEREKEQRKAEKRQKRSEHQRGGDREDERKLKRRAERSSENEEASRTKPAAAKIPKKKRFGAKNQKNQADSSAMARSDFAEPPRPKPKLDAIQTKNNDNFADAHEMNRKMYL